MKSSENSKNPLPETVMPDPIPSSYPGVRIRGGKYLVTKSFGKKRYSKVHPTMEEAIRWKINYDPYRKDDEPMLHPTLEEVMKEYFKSKDDELSLSTKTRKIRRMNSFVRELLKHNLDKITRETISKHIIAKKIMTVNGSRRENFNKELKDLASVMRWYHENRKEYINPVLKSHFKEGEIDNKTNSKKSSPINLSSKELELFISKLKEPYRTFARIQVGLELTIAETAAIAISSVNLHDLTLTISRHVVWLKSSPAYAKECRSPRVIKIPPYLKDPFLGLTNTKAKVNLLFQKKGRPLRYNAILENYKKAILAAGLGILSGSEIRLNEVR